MLPNEPETNTDQTNPIPPKGKTVIQPLHPDDPELQPKTQAPVTPEERPRIPPAAPTTNTLAPAVEQPPVPSPTPTPVVAGTPMVGSFASSEAQMPVEQSKPRSHKPLILLSSLVALLVIGVGVFGYMILTQNTAPPDDTSQLPAAQGDGAFKKALQENKETERLKLLDSISSTFYMPAGLKPERTSVLVNPKNGQASMSYAIGLKFGMGLMRGTFAFSVRNVTSVYNPPTDCGLTNGQAAAGPLTCPLFEGSSKKLQAYVYEGGMPGSIRNTEVSEYRTMYAKIGNSLITISTADTSAAEIYGFMERMQPIRPADLPANTELYSL